VTDNSSLISDEVGSLAEQFEAAPLRTTAAVLARRRRLVLGIPLVFATFALTYFLLFGSYLAQSSFMPQSSGSSLAGLAGIAAQFGSRLPSGLGGDASESLDFYSRLLSSPTLLDRVARHEYRFRRDDTDSTLIVGNLYTLYGYTEGTQSERTRRLVEQLQARVSTDVDRLGNTVTLRVKAPYPELAQQLNRQLLEALNLFNLQQRQSAAAAQRRFAEERTASARLELKIVEDSLRRFLEANRIYQSDPRLVVEFGRLQRRIELAQTVYVTLARTLEESRIEEVRNTPVITVIDRPELFAKRSRSLAVVFLGAFTVGMLVSVTAAVIIEALRTGSIDSRGGTRNRRPQLSRVWRRLLRVRTPAP